MARFWKPVGLVLILVACTPGLSESPLPTPGVFESPVSPQATALPPVALGEGLGGVRGKIVTGSLPWAPGDVHVYACPFSGTEQDGFYILEPSVHPSTILSPDGSFQIADMAPGAYVLVAGPNPEEAIVFQEAGRTRIFYIEPDQMLDVGKVDLR